MEGFSLILDGSCEKVGSLLEEHISSLRAHSLSLNDCHLDANFPVSLLSSGYCNPDIVQGVVNGIIRMPCLRSLSIGGANVVGLKKHTKNSSVITSGMNELVKLITTSQVCVFLLRKGQL